MCILNFTFLTAKWKAKDSALNDSKHSLVSGCPLFHPNWKFHSIRLFPIFLTIPFFQRNYYQSVHCEFVLLYDFETRPCTQFYQLLLLFQSPQQQLLKLLYVLLQCICSQILELFHTLKGTIISLHIVTSSCVVISRHDHVLSFISIYFQTSLLTSNY